MQIRVCYMAIARGVVNIVHPYVQGPMHPETSDHRECVTYQDDPVGAVVLCGDLR